MYDFDILATTNNEEFINGVFPNQRVVTYDVRKPKKKIFTEDDLFVTDTFSFGTQIGQITNTTSTFVGMMAMFDKESPEYKRLGDRVKAGCAAQSRQIDKTKIGENVKTLGTCCKVWQRIKEDDSEEVKEEKRFLNRILAEKKPYFFKYKYKALFKELKEYDNKYQELAQLKFGRDLKDIIEDFKDGVVISEEEMNFLGSYEKWLPVVDSDCVMNKICKHIEGIDFHIKKKVRSGNGFDYTVLMGDSPWAHINVNSKVYGMIKTTVSDTFKEWAEASKKNNPSQSNQSTLYSNLNANNDEIDKNKFERSVACNLLKQKLEDIVVNEELLTNYLIYLFYVDKPGYSKSTLWSMVGQQIYENIKDKHNTFNFPVRDENGSIEFLYNKYQVKNMEIPKIVPETPEDVLTELMEDGIFMPKEDSIDNNTNTTNYLSSFDDYCDNCNENGDD